MDLRSVDLHLLACFDALMAELSVTHAANRMNITQPAMSNALARMRTLFGDQLLVRTNQGMVPTERAIELRRAINPALQALSAAIRQPGVFNPQAASLRFSIATSDYIETVLLQELVPVLRTEAPQVELVMVPPDRTRAREWLESGEVDFVLGYHSELSEDLRAVELYRDPICCIAAANHPTIRGELDLDQYVRAGHVYCGGVKGHHFTTELITDRVLEAKSVQRKIAIRSVSQATMSRVVAASDLIGTISRRSAELYAKNFKVQVLELPFELPQLTVSLVWHERTHRTAGAQWLRQVIRGCSAWSDPASSGVTEVG